MDFFGRQDTLRWRTTVLLAAFLLAVAVIVVLIAGVAWVFGLGSGSGESPGFGTWLTHPTGLAVISGVTVYIGAVSLYRWHQLRQGGGNRVARLLGGRFVDPATGDNAERALLRVTEEMAIAAGITAPQVYVLDDEPGLNAFAAGNEPGDAAVAVTRGLLDSLDRDELQGVLAHEISHITRGDTRLNMRMLAALAGLTQVGEHGVNLCDRCWDYLAMTDRYRGGIVFGYQSTSTYLLGMAVGALLATVGWVGVLLARVIKAAIARQREFMADAGSVQYTRNPDGLAGALLKLEVSGAGSRLLATNAEEISHMAFAGLATPLTWLTASHPPIEERMAALGAKYRVWHRRQQRDQERQEASTKDPDSSPANGGSGGGSIGMGAMPGMDNTTGLPDAVTDVFSIAVLGALTGTMDSSAVQHARGFVQRLPTTIQQAATDPAGAAQLIYALLLPRGSEREEAIRCLPETERDATQRLRSTMDGACANRQTGELQPASRLALLELALPRVAELDADAVATLRACVQRLLKAQGQVSLFGFAAWMLIHQQHREDEGHRPIGMATLADRSESLRIILSLVAHAAGSEDTARDAAYARACRALGGLPGGERAPPRDCSPKAFRNALEQLDTLQHQSQETLLQAVATSAHDGRRLPADAAALLRVIAGHLHRPVPAIT